MPETELSGPELDLSIKCSVTNTNDKKDHTMNFTLLEPRRGAKNLAAGLRLHGLDITVWYKVNFRNRLSLELNSKKYNETYPIFFRRAKLKQR